MVIITLSVQLVTGSAYHTILSEEPETFDSLHSDSLLASTEQDTTARKKSGGSGGAFLDDIIQGKAEDSLHYDVKNKMVYIYEKGDINYRQSKLEADYMSINMDTREVYAHGKRDTVEGMPTIKKPVFTDGGVYEMDTITYNLKSSKAKIRGVATQEGDGWLIGTQVKKMPDNAINIVGGKYTTCDITDHPHFYLAMTKAKMIPGKKIITGPAYMVLEDVPLPLIIPEAFFPISSGAQSGLLMPTYGEDATRGFFLRDIGYYFTFNDYVDLTLLGGIYSLGSWDLSATSRYIKKYKYSGNVNLTYSNIQVGEKGDADFTKSNAVRVQWTHSQDSKANPGSTFSASVNFATSGYSRYSANTLNDILQTQTNSSISYSKNWAGTPFSLSANTAISQNSKTKTISVTLPTVVFNVSRFYPFKRKEALGKKRWYEQISMSYTGKLTNSVSALEEDILSTETLKDMSNGIQHSIPISASLKLFNYINIQPSMNYTERWYFKEQERAWNPETNTVDYLDPNYGFFRLYNYNASVSASTTVYGTYQNKNSKSKIQAIRHTIAPSIGMSYAPDFSQQKYGFYKVVQSDSMGRYQVYSPYSGNAYGVPGSGKSMSLNFSLQQSLQLKVLSKRDTSGVKKIPIIDQLNIGGSYNFLADSMRFSLNAVTLNTKIGKYGLKLNLGIDPYRVSPEGKRYNQLFFPGRLTSTSWTYGYSYNSPASSTGGAMNDINQIAPEFTNPFYDPYGMIDAELRRQYMSRAYYDFSIPWNFGFNYRIGYAIRYVNNGTTGYEPNITQSLSFNGAVTLTQKWGVNFNASYDIKENKLSGTQVSINRDLHCWQMSFNWIPLGYYRSWSFHIGVKASSLADLKYDKEQSMYDHMY